MKTSRREFIVAAGASAVATGVAAAPAVARAARAPRGHVVQVTDDRMTKANRAVEDVARQMLSRGMVEFTGKKSAADAWGSLFSPKDMVAIKINCLGKPCMSTTPEVVSRAKHVRGSISLRDW